MKNISIQSLFYLAFAFLFLGCTETTFLDYTPKGFLSEEQLGTPEAVEKLCNAAYSTLAAGQWRAPYNSKWMYGSVRSDDAYKGGGGTNDQGQWNLFEGFTHVTPQEGDWAGPDKMWFDMYRSIQRANFALKYLDQLDESEFPMKTQRIGEMRFLRGHYYYSLKVLFKFIPYIDETLDEEEIKELSNQSLGDQELWNKIAEDFKFAISVLPEKQEQIGRVNKFAAYSYLAKSRLFQAYEQNENHAVVNINANLLNEVIENCDKVINSGQYELFDDIAKNFLWDYDNLGPESIFAVQYSVDDGTDMGNVNMESALNYNTSARYGCCSFHQPTQNLVNAHRTDAETGLPIFDNFNDVPMINAEDFQVNTFDPRLDHTIGIPGHPFKYDPTFVYNTGWVRDPDTYGPFSPMREVQHPDCPCATVAKGYAYNTDSKNLDLIRYAEVLLWKAEALIQLGRHNEALPLINQIRARAANSTGRLVRSDGSPISNYKIEEYVPGVNCDWTKDFAFIALQWERRMELAMSGERFSDLVRWGIAAEVLNDYFDKERNYRVHLKEARFTKGKHEYLPISQEQIDLSRGVYVQNIGYN